ncbi:hypothetical protein HMI54_004448, partial [Coelomomyces lativittatus]
MNITIRKVESVSKESSPEKPNFNVTGKLTQAMKTIDGTVLKYSEPIEAEKPNQKFCIVVFKENTCLSTIYLHRKTFYLFGRDRTIVDVPTEHPSCSKQHAVIQFRRTDVDGKTMVKYVFL